MPNKNYHIVNILSRIHFFLFLSLSFYFYACTEDDDVGYPPDMPQSDIDIIEYFKETALGFQSDIPSKIVRKWTTPMQLYITGQSVLPEEYEIEQTINEINSLATDGFRIEIVEDSASADAWLFFANVNDYVALFPDEADRVDGKAGRFVIRTNTDDEINFARIWVKNTIEAAKQQSLFIEELTQSLGLARDSDWYPGSIFYETPTDGGFATSYLDIDRELIRLLYHPRVRVGMDAPAVQRVLIDILLNE